MSTDQTVNTRDGAVFASGPIPRPPGADRGLGLRVRSVAGATIVDILDTDALFVPGDIRDLSEQLHRLVDSGRGQMVLDFRGVRSMSSDVLGILASLHRQLGDPRRRLELVGFDPTLREMLRICRPDRLFDVEPDGSETPGSAGRPGADGLSLAGRE